MNILIYGDSMSWGIIPGSRNRLPFSKRWPGVLQASLGDDYRIIEECLNGRTTKFEDVNRPARNGLEHIQMIMESHSPIDMVIVMLGINDFQDVIAATAKESALGLGALIAKIKTLAPEPMQQPAKILAVVPPEIQQPLEAMAGKFAGFRRGEGSEAEYLNVLNEAGVDILQASHIVSLSKFDGIHLDEAEHMMLGKAVADKIVAYLNTSS